MLGGDASLRGDEIELTAVGQSQTGTAFMQVATTSTDPFVVRYWLFTGQGTGADGQCVSVGSNDLGDRAGEDGVGVGVAVCFDEWSNGGDDGICEYNQPHLLEITMYRILSSAATPPADTPHHVTSMCRFHVIDCSNFLQWRPCLREHIALRQSRRLRAGFTVRQLSLASDRSHACSASWWCDGRWA